MTRVIRSPQYREQSRPAPEASPIAQTDDHAPTPQPSGATPDDIGVTESATSKQPDLDALREQIREELRQEVEQEVQQAAETEIEALKNAALEEARGQAEDEAKAEANKVLDAKLAELDEVIGRLSGHVDAAVEGVGDMAAEVAFATVCKLLGETAHSAEGVFQLTKQVLSRLSRSGEVIVRVRPRDMELLQGQIGALERTGYGLQLRLVADESIHLGGCVLESQTGSLDARLEHQMARLRDVLLGAAAEQSSQTGEDGDAETVS